MRRYRPLALILALLLLAAACGDDSDTADDDSSATTEADASGEEGTEDDGDAEEASGTVTIEHYSGTDEVPTDPETVVVMDTGVALSLLDLGIAIDGLGVAGTVPDELADIESVGTAFEPDYEAINALEPDLIIVATRSSATYPDMSEIAPTVDLTPAEDVDYLEALRARHESIGEIFGVEDEVAERFDAIDARVEEIAAQTGEAGDALILMTSGAEVTAYGPGSRFGLVHDLLGYGAADESLSDEATHGEAVSFEFILEAAPDVMFVIDRSAAIGEEGEAAEQVLDNELVGQTPAWSDDRVVYVDSFAWYITSNSLPGIEQILDDVESSLP
ncbi:siderophore ABC transporter substrate-binding protein [Actinomarinicola tropica]|uniref:ABC transporter substrate-binding protein n=1 Tax=Actinomarinicola tropica TaxID=2789776 RepID=A0A5Q2RKM8_9ACTN|nr:ABC transporter substrate-binding protein [Actinomarinicola tropica]QGG94410.1 ABC transporter substrate-binding protein [Actinomarinicola tropica]